MPGASGSRGIRATDSTLNSPNEPRASMANGAPARTSLSDPYWLLAPSTRTIKGFRLRAVSLY